MRETYTARLERKVLLSSAAECYHFEFVLTGDSPSALAPGQFFSMLAEDSAGKTYTRAYSIASGPKMAVPDGAHPSPAFDLCVNRVEGGFFSNLLCDLKQGDTVRCHGPHGLFVLRPSTDALMIAAGTGIAPMRGFAQWLFPEDGPDRSGGRGYWLVYESPNSDELFYSSYFEQLAATYNNFHYLPVTGGDGDHRELLRELATITATNTPGPADAASQEFDSYAYVCGLSEIVKAARAELLALGWQKRQILFERYD